MFVRSLLTFLLVSFPLTRALAETSVAPLAEARAKLALPEYSPDERQLLADQADLLLRRLYVNREMKIAQYGEASDPVPRLDAIRREARGMSSEALHQGLQRVFIDLHDLHTTYRAPVPLSCGISFIPLRFTEVKDGDRTIVIASQRLKLQAELAEGVEMGDRLVEVDGEATDEVLARLGPLSGGANPDAARSRSIEMLSFRSGASQTLPARDRVKLKLEGKAGAYEKEIPWMALIDEDCLSESPDDEAPPKIGPLDLAEDEFQKQFNRLFGAERPLAGLPAIAAATNPLSEVFEAALLDTPSGKIGYIRLKAFYWSSKRLDTGTVVESLRRTVEAGFAEAKGIVIDVRGNPGGLITFAEKLIQLFSSGEVAPSSVRMLANELNQEIFVRANGGKNRWSEAVETAIGAGAPYAGPLSITPLSEANDLGQVWFRPVAVLTDANCYSACDIFAAGMQDRGAGVVIGLHEHTGGGGANVMEQSTFRAILSEAHENPFKALPRKQSMRVSWRQVLRAGKNQGKPIEGEGVRADIVVPLTRADIGKEPKELMRQIRRVLEEQAPHHRAGLAPRPGGLVLLANGEKASWLERAWGVDSIELFAAGKRVAALNVPPSEEVREITVVADALRGEWRDDPVVVVGRRDGKMVFRSVRELKWRGEYLSMPPEGLRADFAAGKLDPFRTVLVHGQAGSGWQIAEGKLRVGPGPKYANSVHSRAFVPLRLDGKRAKLKFDLEVKAESPYDTLRIFIVNPDSGERIHVFAGSNVPKAKGAAFSFPAGWHRGEAVFEFESDENWVLEGPVISNFELVSPAP